MLRTYVRNKHLFATRGHASLHVRSKQRLPSHLPDFTLTGTYIAPVVRSHDVFAVVAKMLLQAGVACEQVCLRKCFLRPCWLRTVPSAHILYII